MNKWQKIGLAAGMGTAVITTTHIINKFIFQSAILNGFTDKAVQHTYNWKFGNIAYFEYGDNNATPLLLVHDLNVYSSSYEWDNVVKYFARNHHVYVLDLLGCGHSEKPHITYTTYMFTQLISDFTSNVIGIPADIIATGDSAPIALGAVYTHKDLFNKVILVSPKSISKAMTIPKKPSIIRRRLLEIPVIGTTIFNMCVRKYRLNEILAKKVFSNGLVPNDYLNAAYENAHLSGSSSKFLFISTECNYTVVAISEAVSKIDNCIYIINGSETKEYAASEYIALNPAIEVVDIEDSGKLPQVEQPIEFVNQADIFLDI